ncbi:TPA: FaeA/PapI family transcriptional regulator [Pseudomonas aeruginosa]
MTTPADETYPDGMHRTLGNALQALKHCARKRYRFPPEDALESAISIAAYYREHIETGDKRAIQIGPLVGEVADSANLTNAQARRYLLELEALGLAMREPPHMRGTAHRWWPVGFSEALVAERPAF